MTSLLKKKKLVAILPLITTYSVTMEINEI